MRPKKPKFRIYYFYNGMSEDGPIISYGFAPRNFKAMKMAFRIKINAYLVTMIESFVIVQLMRQTNHQLQQLQSQSSTP